MTHGSLFSGIGGIDLGFEWAGIETKWQVEIDPYCRELLGKRFPNAKQFEDVKTVGKHNLEKVDIVSGGFPCQDISIAGKSLCTVSRQFMVLLNWLDATIYYLMVVAL